MPHREIRESPEELAARAIRINQVSIAVPDPVGLDTPNLAWAEMDIRWKKMEDLQKGSDHMRDQSTVYLPMFKQESDDAYRSRIRRTFLFPGYEDGIDNFVSKPYARNIIVAGADNEEDIQELIKDMDGTGKSITQWGKEAFEAAQIYGYTHGLTDFASMPEDASKADEDDQKVNIIHITPRMLFAWRHDENDELEQIRYKEIRTEPHDDFGEVQREYIRVFNKTEWVVYRREVTAAETTSPQNTARTPQQATEDAISQWTIIDAGFHSFGGVPLRTYHITETDLNFSSKPTHEGLADANLEHYQKKSDQDNILHHTRVPFMFGAGFGEDERGIVVVGSSRAVFSKNENADLKYVEHGGTAIDSGAQDIEKVERRMEVLGMQPFINRGGTTTATERGIDEADKEADIKAWIRNEEKFLENLIPNT